MFHGHKLVRKATALCALTATVCALLAAPLEAGRGCADQSAARPACSAGRKACCCAPEDAAQVCRCHGEPDPTPPIAPAADDCSRPLKWAPVEACSPDVNIAPADRTSQSHVRNFFTPAGRSLQSLLCVWRT